MAHWLLTAPWVRHPRLRRGAKVSPFLCRGSRRRSIASLTLNQSIPGSSSGRHHFLCTALRDRGPRSILIARCRRSALRPPDAAWSSVEDAGGLFVPSVERDGVTAVDQ